MTIQKFVSKYGVVGWRFLLNEYLNRSPEFPGREQISLEINRMCEDLQKALENL